MSSFRSVLVVYGHPNCSSVKIEADYVTSLSRDWHGRNSVDFGYNLLKYKIDSCKSL